MRAGVLLLLLMALPGAAAGITLQVPVTVDDQTLADAMAYWHYDQPTTIAFLAAQAQTTLRQAQQGLLSQQMDALEGAAGGDPVLRHRLDELARDFPPAPDPDPGHSITLAAFAGVPLLAWAVGSVWDLGVWVVSSMLIWALCYWLWACKPCRRLLNAVTRRLYPHDTELLS